MKSGLVCLMFLDSTIFSAGMPSELPSESLRGHSLCSRLKLNTAVTSMSDPLSVCNRYLEKHEDDCPTICMSNFDVHTVDNRDVTVHCVLMNLNPFIYMIYHIVIGRAEYRLYCYETESAAHCTVVHQMVLE